MAHRTDAASKEELERADDALNDHLLHCPVCDEDEGRYCGRGAELTVMVTRLLAQEMATHRVVRKSRRQTG